MLSSGNPGLLAPPMHALSQRPSALMMMPQAAPATGGGKLSSSPFGQLGQPTLVFAGPPPSASGLSVAAMGQPAGTAAGVGFTPHPTVMISQSPFTLVQPSPQQAMGYALANSAGSHLLNPHQFAHTPTPTALTGTSPAPQFAGGVGGNNYFRPLNATTTAGGFHVPMVSWVHPGGPQLHAALQQQQPPSTMVYLDPQPPQQTPPHQQQQQQQPPGGSTSMNPGG